VLVRAHLVAAGLSIVTVAGCAPDGSTAHDHSSLPVESASIMGVPDTVDTGPQGRVGQFVVECAFSHVAPDDPIVYPGRSGASHLHVFFGNTSVTASSKAEDLVGADTTCDNSLDTAAYWAPALLRAGEPIEPVEAVAYYRAGFGVDPRSVEPYPSGLAMIAGDAAALEPQPVEVVSWSCGTGALREVTPPECPLGEGLVLRVVFPDCWDGRSLDSPGHRAHVRYSSRGLCPDSHPVPVPQLTFTVDFGDVGDVAGLTLASGDLTTGHADFVNSWDQDRLESEIRQCLHRDLVCGVNS